MSRAGKHNKKILAAFIILALAVSFTVTPLTTASGSNLPAQEGQTSFTDAYVLPIEDWWRVDDLAAVRLVNLALKNGSEAHMALEAFEAGGQTYPAGTFILPKTAENSTLLSFLKWEGATSRVWRFDSQQNFAAATKQLVQPKIVMYFDQSTQTNALYLYETMHNLGFEVILANGWTMNDGAVLKGANLFVMPGGAMHLYGMAKETGFVNIQSFVDQGGGYLGICAGASEAMAKSQYDNLGLVDTANVDMYSTGDWTAFIGPTYLEVEDQTNPVMFGFGPGASRFGNGPQPSINYYGGPAFVDMGAGVTVLASYASPTLQKLSVVDSPFYGKPAVVTAKYGEGTAVLFGPHPELSDVVGARMWANAIFYATNKPAGSGSFEQSQVLHEAAAPAGIGATEMIPEELVAQYATSTEGIKSASDDLARSAARVYNLRMGNRYDPLGIWYDYDILMYAKHMSKHANEVQRAAGHLEYEFAKLTSLEAAVSGSSLDENTKSALLAEIKDLKQRIVSYFQAGSTLNADQHMITEDFAEPASFADLPGKVDTVTQMVDTQLLPFCEEMKVRQAEINALTAAGDPNLEAKYTEYSEWAMGSYGITMPALDILQYKVDSHLMNAMTIGKALKADIDLLNYELAEKLGRWTYFQAETGAFLSHPSGPFLR